MHKWVYDKMVEEYQKEEKIDLIHQIMSYSNIEVSDRCFANQCCAGADVYNINELFEYLQENVSPGDYNLLELLKKAAPSWEYIRSGLAEMKRDTRVFEAEKDFEKRVSEAKEPYDSI